MRELGKLKDIDFEKLRAVIFDFDGTLYSGGNWNGYEENLIHFFMRNGVNKSEWQIMSEERAMPGLDIFHRMIEYAKANGIDPQKLIDYDDRHFFYMDTTPVHFINLALLGDLKNYYKLFIVSDSSGGYLRYYMDKYGVDRSNFEQILSNDFSEPDYSKVGCYKRIIDATKLEPSQILMVGDSYRLDIETAARCKMQSYHVSGKADTNRIINMLIKKAQKSI